MSHLHWHYSGPVPPSPFVASTVPQYIGGQPTPPPTPPRVRATVDDYAPCPPTPRCVPSGVDQDDPETFSGPDHWLISDLDHSTAFANPLAGETPDDDEDLTPHVSDALIYDRETYAYPSPVLAMIKRATLDLHGLQTRPVNLRACGQPFKLFSLSGGHIPVTGLKEHDDQSFDYYVKIPHPSLLRASESVFAYSFSIGTIRAVQEELHTKWPLVYPQPIPPVIVRSDDLVGPYDLRRCNGGFAFVVPADNSTWGAVCQRGIDSTFRPLNPSATVQTSLCHKGDALYYPQHIVASDFAVNVFLESPDLAGPTSRCQYLGAYVLQLVDVLTLDSAIWADIEPDVQQAVSDRVFEGSEGHECPPAPQLPLIQFRYYKWDECIVGLADDIRYHYTVEACQGFEGESVDSDGSSVYSDSGSDTNQRDWGSASSPVYSPEDGDTSHFSSCE